MNDAKIALVTGGARRLGAAIVEALHAAGCCVLIHHRRSSAAAAALAARLEAVRPGSAAVVQADLLEDGAAKALVDAARRHFGGLDVLVNNASSFYPTPLDRVDEAQWTELIGVHVKAPLFLARTAAPLLRARCGAIVNITDVYAEKPLPGHLLYCTAKAALAALTRALALELAPKVRVNAVAPGAILWPENGVDDAAARLAAIPLGRCGDPADIGRAVRQLALESPYVTGATWVVDGGRSLRLP
ncbi:MAG: pteridine reductase [Gammaproteobacteria bacterium]|nr:MAG: pteridine reductase [Gammaproteobacteria bacterium]